MSERGSGLSPKGQKIFQHQSDNILTADKSQIDLKLDPNLEQSAKRKGKKRGRKPSIKKLINNENTSDSISKINDNLLSESGELESKLTKLHSQYDKDRKKS